MSEKEVTVKRRRKNISTRMREEVEKRKKSKGKKVSDMTAAEAKKSIRNRKRRKIKSVDQIPTKKITEKAMFDCCTYEINKETIYVDLDC